MKEAIEKNKSTIWSIVIMATLLILYFFIRTYFNNMLTEINSNLNNKNNNNINIVPIGVTHKQFVF